MVWKGCRRWEGECEENLAGWSVRDHLCVHSWSGGNVQQQYNCISKMIWKSCAFAPASIHILKMCFFLTRRELTVGPKCFNLKRLTYGGLNVASFFSLATFPIKIQSDTHESPIHAIFLCIRTFRPFPLSPSQFAELLFSIKQIIAQWKSFWHSWNGWRLYLFLVRRNGFASWLAVKVLWRRSCCWHAGGVRVPSWDLQTKESNIVRFLFFQSRVQSATIAAMSPFAGFRIATRFSFKDNPFMAIRLSGCLGNFFGIIQHKSATSQVYGCWLYECHSSLVI